MKKLMPVLLALCLIIGMMPMMALAADDDGGEVTGIESIGPEDTPVTTENDLEITIPQVSYNDGTGTKTMPIDKVMMEAKARNNTTQTYYKDVADAITEAESGETVEVLADASINENVTLGEGVTLAIEEGVTLTINSGFKLTVEGAINDKFGTIIGEYGPETSEPEEPEEPEPEEPEPGDDEPKPEPPVALYPVTIYAPSGAVIEVKDAEGDICANFNGNVWTLADGEYTYTITYCGETYFGKFTVDGGPLFVNKEWTEPAWRVTVIPSSRGDVWVSDYDAARGEIVRIYVEPDSGYYLEDLTVTTESGRDVEVWHVRDGVFAFRMTYSPVTVDADFAALPDEHRVYVEPTVNGDLSVDEVWAEEGEWVYITVKPDAGYRLDELTVTRPSGNEVKVYHVRDNVFRFKMPGVRVTVDAEFVRSSLPFSDVSRGQWFYDYVAWAYNTGLMEGVSAGRFAPNSTTTRAMVVTIIYRLAGSPGVSGTSDFTDVPAGAWYSDAVTWAAKRGIVEGMTATTFDPNDAVTREELAAMLYRYAKHKGYDTSAAENTNILSYNDALSISEYAFEALQWACGEGIINGTGAGSLEPGGSATRAQLAAMLYRFCAEYVY